MNRLNVASDIQNFSASFNGSSKFVRDLMHNNFRQDESDKLAVKLQEMDRRKNEFLATLAHELRNSLAPIKHALDSMAMMQLNDEVDGLRKMMARQVDQMVHLIDDLLDISRISCGKIALRNEVIALRSIIESAVEASSTFIAESGQILTVSELSDEWFVFADPSRLTQVVSNLLNNSAKYSGPECRIELNVSVENELVTIRVRDNGIGIATNQLDNIFTLFTQVGNSVERGSAGLGIGLTLVKTLVELHGGTVIAESEGVGHGSVFTVRLPAAKKPVNENIEPIDSSIVHASESRSFRVLIIDDLRPLRLVMARLLEKLGHTVEVADSGAQAIEKLENFTPEIIFSDISMPGISGYDLVRILRQREDMKLVFIVAMTGSGTAIDRELALESGFDEHLTKPVDIRSLRKIFASLSMPLT